MSKYAPAREDGLKPYVVNRGGLKRIGWGATPARAASDAFGPSRSRWTKTTVRRATPADMEDPR